MRPCQSQKNFLSSDRSLQLDCVKLESLVIADQHAAGNTFPGLVHTARHTMGADKGRSRRANPAPFLGMEHENIIQIFVPKNGAGRQAPKLLLTTGVKS